MNFADDTPIASGQHRRWIANVLVGYGDAAVGGLIYLYITPLLVSSLGNEGYALWIVSHTICFYLQFLDTGLGGAQIRYHARFNARARQQEVRKLTATVSLALFAAGILATALGVLIAFAPLHWWTEASTSLQADFRLSLCLLAISLFVAFPSSVLNNIYQGAQRYDLRNLRSIVLRILTLAAQLLVLNRGGGIVELAALELTALCLRTLIDVVLIKRLLPNTIDIQLHFYRDTWQKIRRFSLWSFADDLLVEGTPKLDSLFIVIVLPLALLTPYTLCVAAAGILMMAVHPVIDTFFPMAADLHARNRRGSLRHLLLSGSKLCLTLATPVAVFLAVFGTRVLTLWVPESAQLLSTYVLPLIVLNVWISVFLSVPAIILAAINGIRTVVVLTLAEVSLTLVLILLLSPSLQLTGVALACVLTNASVGFVVQLPIAARAVGQHLTSLLLHSFLRITAAALPCVVVACVLVASWPTANWTQLATAAVSIGITFIVAMLIVGTTSQERAEYLRLFRKLRHDELHASEPVALK